MSRKPVKRRPLNAGLIAGTALALADADGMESFSFRNLAQKLGCEAMSIYHYFPSKAHLIDAMVAICLSEVSFADRQAPWQERLRVAARNWRAMALRHPGFFPVVAVHRLNFREGLTTLNHIVEIFAASGLSIEAQARHFRVFGYYIVGAGLDEAIGYAKGPSAAVPVEPEEAMKLFPAIISIGKWFASEHREKTFDVGLESLIAGMEAALATEMKMAGHAHGAAPPLKA